MAPIANALTDAEICCFSVRFFLSFSFFLLLRYCVTAKEDEEKEKKKKEDEAKRKKKDKEKEEKRKKKEKEEEEKRRKKAEEEKAEKTNAAARAIGVIARAMHFVARALPCAARAMPLRFSFQAGKTSPNVKKAPQQAAQPQLASKPAPKQPLPVPDQPQEQGGLCGSTPPNTALKAKQQSKADVDKLARDEFMLRRDWSYKDGYKPRCIIYSTTAIAPMVVEGAQIKPAWATRAPQDHMAVIMPTISGAPANKGANRGRRRRKRTTGRSSCPPARCSPPKAKRMRSWTSGSRGGRCTSPMKLWTSTRTQRP